ncbi:hypothetical protein ACFSHP_03665 [Novosphingobium panipatense]
MLSRLGVKVGALDLFVPAMLRPQTITLWRQLARVAGKQDGAAPDPAMPPPCPPAAVARPPATATSANSSCVSTWPRSCCARRTMHAAARSTPARSAPARSAAPSHSILRAPYPWV